MAEHPTPVVMCSALTEAGSRASVKALSYGAVEVIAKPKIHGNTSFPEAAKLICNAIKAAAKVNIDRVKTRPVKTSAKVSAKAPSKRLGVAAKISPEDFMPAAKVKKSGIKRPLIAIGTSTGGTQALELVLELVLAVLPLDTPPILIVQHMPETFIKAFAERLNSICRIEVKEAEDNDRLLPGRALVAPGGYHMILEKNHGNAFVRIKDGPLVSRHKPSVDVLFHSVSQYADEKCLGIIMTGMGDDGALGLKAMRDAGAYTLGQDENSCVVYGMPWAAQKKRGRLPAAFFAANSAQNGELFCR